MPQLLTEAEVDAKLQNLPHWSKQGEQLEANFKFENFEQALDFVNKIGAEAQEMDHHPDILLHGWNQVKLTVSTHSASGITENDMELARRAVKVVS